MHNGFLQVEGEKMAKSAGNFVTVHELLTDWHGYAWPGEALRFNMLRTHYRQPLDWTLVGLDEAHKTLWEWYGDLEGKDAGSRRSRPGARCAVGRSQHAQGHHRAAQAAQRRTLGQLARRARLPRLLRRARRNIERVSQRIVRCSGEGRADAVDRCAQCGARRRTSRRRTASATSWKPWASLEGRQGPQDRRARHHLGGGR